MVLDAVGLDRRIGRIFFNPGIGYGGSCFPKDVQAIISTGEENGINSDLFKAVENINQQSRDNFVNKILKHAKGKNVALWGLAFKPNTDDIRFAPSHTVIKTLLKKGYKISAYDPAAADNIKNVYGDEINYFNDPYETVKGVDALCILTEWNEFMQVNLSKVKQLMNHPLIIDGRNIYTNEKMKQLGFSYISTGRTSVIQ
jgi:UDPglucose 6-dehydrogenase